MKIVKDICPKCKTAIEPTKTEVIATFVRSILSSLGVIFVFYLLIVGIRNPLNDLTNIRFEALASHQDDQMRLMMLNITDCDGDDSYCYAEQLYWNVSRTRYVPSSEYDFDGMYDPLYVYEHGGDCKNSASMYISFLRSVGIQGYVDCNAVENHCVAVVPYIKGSRYRGEKVVVDLTGPVAIRIYDNEEVWDYWDIYQNDSTGWRNMAQRDREWSYQW